MFLFLNSNLMSRWWQRDWSPLASDEVVTMSPGYLQQILSSSVMSQEPLIGLANQRPEFRGHVINDQSEASIGVR